MVMLLSRSGVNLLSLITTSAVLTAVIGLALQDTLGNLFSGVAMQLESSIAIGDWIRVDEQAHRPRARDPLALDGDSHQERRHGDHPQRPVRQGRDHASSTRTSLENRRWVYFNVHLRHPPNTVQQIVRDALVGTPNVSTATPPDCITWRYHESWLEYAVRYRLVDLPARRSDRLRGAQAHLVRAASREHRDAVSRRTTCS